MNQIILCGNVGRDPEIRTTNTGKKVANFSVATSDGKGDDKTTDWHTIVAWDWVAESAEKVKKGDKVMISGKMKTSRKYKGKDDVEKTAYEVVAFNIGIVPRGEKTASVPQIDDIDSVPF